jgi:hypothetical protein
MSQAPHSLRYAAGRGVPGGGGASWLRLWLAVVGGVAFMAGPAPAEAQRIHAEEFRLSSELRVAGANIALGGVGAALVAGLSGEPMGPAFLRGAAGGGLVYTGKRIAVERWYGAGLAGRQVALVGGGVTRNASLGRGAFDEVALGFGPVRWYRDREEGASTWALDVPALGLLVWGIADSNRRLDLRETLSSGAAVFVSDPTAGFGGGDHALPGTIFLSGHGSEERVAYVLAHERVHILQFDQFHFLLGDPVERKLASRLFDTTLPVRLEFNAATLGTAAFLGFQVWRNHDDQPWEWEAIYLARRRQ